TDSSVAWRCHIAESIARITQGRAYSRLRPRRLLCVCAGVGVKALTQLRASTSTAAANHSVVPRRLTARPQDAYRRQWRASTFMSYTIGSFARCSHSSNGGICLLPFGEKRAAFRTTFGAPCSKMPGQCVLCATHGERHGRPYGGPVRTDRMVTTHVSPSARERRNRLAWAASSGWNDHCSRLLQMRFEDRTTSDLHPKVARCRL